MCIASASSRAFDLLCSSANFQSHPYRVSRLKTEMLRVEWFPFIMIEERGCPRYWFMN